MTFGYRRGFFFYDGGRETAGWLGWLAGSGAWRIAWPWPNQAEEVWLRIVDVLVLVVDSAVMCRFSPEHGSDAGHDIQGHLIICSIAERAVQYV